MFVRPTWWKRKGWGWGGGGWTIVRLSALLTKCPLIIQRCAIHVKSARTAVHLSVMWRNQVSRQSIRSHPIEPSVGQNGVAGHWIWATRKTTQLCSIKPLDYSQKQASVLMKHPHSSTALKGRPTESCRCIFSDNSKADAAFRLFPGRSARQHKDRANGRTWQLYGQRDYVDGCWTFRFFFVLSLGRRKWRWTVFNFTRIDNVSVNTVSFATGL